MKKAKNQKQKQKNSPFVNYFFPLPGKKNYQVKATFYVPHMKHLHKLRIAGSGINKMAAIGCVFRGLWRNSVKTANVCLRSAPKPAVLFSSNTGKILIGRKGT